ncbi:MAG TPA: efflux RND transporter periplasmic adaptor subunit [Hyphomicrobiaceae bacterium]|nr:efflux RND transporter periplasmic adaptor subunit [Hyphomicrobiaceae bacterium]
MLPTAGAQSLTRSGTPLPIRGIVRPLQQAMIAADISARIAAIRFREAQGFKKGDRLVEFDCERLEAEAAAADALWRETKLSLESNSYLEKRGAAGRIDVEISRARADKAGSEAAALKARLKQCVIIAPYDGRVAELTINEHEFPSAGKPFISIVATGEFEIDLIVPSHWLKTLTPGATFTFAVDETGQSHAAHVLRIGAAVDPVSQTVKVIATFLEKGRAVLPGMSGTATFAKTDGAP